jgi:tetrahydromethanopterin S-methyltransferase subunit A
MLRDIARSGSAPIGNFRIRSRIDRAQLSSPPHQCRSATLTLIDRLSRAFKFRQSVTRGGVSSDWPFLPGRYRVINSSAPVVIAIDGLDEIAGDIESLAPSGLCMTAELRSKSDVTKLIRNIVANLSIQRVIVVGSDSAKRQLGRALVQLGGGVMPPESRQNGNSAAVTSLVHTLEAQIDDEDLQEVRDRVEFVWLLGCSDVDKIVERVAQSASEAKRPNVGFVTVSDDDESGVERVLAAENVDSRMRPDKAGDFRIRIDGNAIVVEHYGQKEKLIRLIEGSDARDICLTLIRNGWVSKLDHAAYLGRELTLAEQALNRGEKYVQDRAPN